MERGLHNIESALCSRPWWPVDGSGASVELIGEGCQGTVYKVTANTADTLAVKVIRLTTKRHQRAFEAEKQCAQVVCMPGPHTYLPKVVDIFVLGTNAFIAMEFLTGETLEHWIDRLGALDVASAVTVGQCLAEALLFMHDKNFAHRDVKPANVLVDADTEQVKLIDFGFAVQITPGVLTTESYGTPLYMPPEVLACQPHSSLAHDSWAFGQVLYEMAVGHSLFAHCRTRTGLQQEIAHYTASPYAIAGRLPKALQPTFVACFSREGSLRPTMPTIRDMLRAR